MQVLQVPWTTYIQAFMSRRNEPLSCQNPAFLPALDSFILGFFYLNGGKKTFFFFFGLSYDF